MDILFIALYLQIPIVIGGIIHMIAVTKNWLPTLRQPIHSALFGANKTWRGLFLVPILTSVGALCLLPIEWALGGDAIFGNDLLLIGYLAGWGYVLAELPNSFLKRRMGIASGETPNKNKHLFIFLDQFDSGAGVAITYFLYPGFGWQVCLLYALTFPLTALAVKRWLFYMKLKKAAV